MCSTTIGGLADRVAAMERAIAHLAAAAASERNGLPMTQSDLADADCASQVMPRLAALWAQLAELDPEVARRVPTYLA